MDKKKLIFSYVLQVLAVATLFITIMPIIKVPGASMTVFEIVLDTGNWIDMEQYLFGIAGLITIISAPLLIITAELSKLSACGVIKCKKLDLALYIINIVLASLIAGVIVNYFLGLGRTIGVSGLKLFQGVTWFKYATAFFYLHCALAIAMVVIACLYKTKKIKEN